MYFWVQFHRSTFLAVQLTLPGISLVQAMGWQQTGDKPLPEPPMIRFLSLYAVTRPQWINSSWNNESKWQHRSGSTLAQIMAHCSMAPNHYLTQCPLIISEVFWASTEGNTVSQELFKISILDMNLKIINLRLQPHLKGGSPILDVYRPHAVGTHNMIMVLSGDCWRKHICKFKPEHLLTDKSTWKYLDKYQVLCLQVQVSTKYFWISKCQVQVSTKYSIFCIKYQVQVLYLTPTLYISYHDSTVSFHPCHLHPDTKVWIKMHFFPSGYICIWYYMACIIATDVLAMQGARTSAAMILTQLFQENIPVSSLLWALQHIHYASLIGASQSRVIISIEIITICG